MKPNAGGSFADNFPCWSAAAVGHTLLIVTLASIALPKRPGSHDQPIEYEVTNASVLHDHHALEMPESPSVRIGQTQDGWDQQTGDDASAPESKMVTEDANPWSRQPSQSAAQVTRHTPATRKVAPA